MEKKNFVGKVVSGSANVYRQLSAIYPELSMQEIHRKTALDVMTGNVQMSHGDGTVTYVSQEGLRYDVKKGKGGSYMVVALRDFFATLVPETAAVTETIADHLVSLLSDTAKAEIVGKLEANDASLRSEEDFLISRISRTEQELAEYRKQLTDVQGKIVTNDKTILALEGGTTGITASITDLLSDTAKAEMLDKLKTTDTELRGEESFLIERITRTNQELVDHRLKLKDIQGKIVTNDKTLTALK